MDIVIVLCLCCSFASPVFGFFSRVWDFVKDKVVGTVVDAAEGLGTALGGPIAGALAGIGSEAILDSWLDDEDDADNSIKGLPKTRKAKFGGWGY